MLQITSLIDLFDDSLCRHFPSQLLFTMSLVIPIFQIPLSSGLYVLQRLGYLLDGLSWRLALRFFLYFIGKWLSILECCVLSSCQINFFLEIFKILADAFGAEKLANWVSVGEDPHYSVRVIVFIKLVNILSLSAAFCYLKSLKT